MVGDRQEVGMRIAPMTQAELETALDWAAAEGWNPGLGDAAAFLAADPGGFLMGWVEGAPVACISAVRHSDDFGFLGLYICRPEAGAAGWGGRCGRRRWRSSARAPSGSTGWWRSRTTTAGRGLAWPRRTVRFRGHLQGGAASAGVVAAGAAMLPELLALDRAVSGVERPAYLRAGSPTRRTGARWCAWATAGSPAWARSGRAGRAPRWGRWSPERCGGGGAARCAGGLYPGAEVSLDVPETNPAATALAARKGLRPVFETARMYRGAAPVQRPEAWFGEATLELG